MEHGGGEREGQQEIAETQPNRFGDADRPLLAVQQLEIEGEQARHDDAETDPQSRGNRQEGLPMRSRPRESARANGRSDITVDASTARGARTRSASRKNRL